MAANLILVIYILAASKRQQFTIKLYYRVMILDALVMGDTIEKVSKSSILTKVSILSILAKSIGNSIPLEPAMFLVSIAEQSLNTS
jgi:hypothetical protein